MDSKPLLKEKDKPKKERKRSLKAIERELWDLCKKITRIRYKHCYTCSQKNLKGANCQTGHMWPKASVSAYLKYDLRILRLQCFSCNIFRGGMGADFYRNMIEEKGKNFIKKLEDDRRITVESRDHYLKLIEEYKKIFSKNEIYRSYPK